jgi:hypothetical protein
MPNVTVKTPDLHGDEERVLEVGCNTYIFTPIAVVNFCKRCASSLTKITRATNDFKYVL